MPRRKVTMQPLGATTAFRPTRVSSSTCPKPQQSTEGAVVGLVDYSDHTLTAQDKFVCNAVENGNYSDAAYDYFGL
jgi:hypothetical protein